jgi:MFS family permease
VTGNPADETAAVSAATITGIALASVLVPLNSTMVAVALPEVAREFDISKGHAGILVTVYLVAMLVGQPLSGRMADAVGPRRLAVIAVTGFGVCSAAAMFAGSFPVLIGLRAAQAAFASALMPSVQAMLRMVTRPSERGRAFGVQGSVIGVGAGLGPVIGGLVIALFGWRAIFGVNLPIVAVVLFVLSRRVPGEPAVEDRPIPRERGAHPTGDERVVNPVFVAAFSVQALSVLAQYALLLITPIVLDDRGWSSAAIGLALSALTLGQILTGPPGGRLGDRRGRRVPVLRGLAVCLVGVTASAVLGDGVASAVLIATLLCFGLGLGLATPSVQTAGMEAAPDSRIGLASGVLSMSRYVGSITASLLLAALVDDAGAGVAVMLLVSAGSLAVSLAAAWRLPSRPLRPLAVEPAE